MLVDGEFFDSASLARMLYDAKNKRNGAVDSPLSGAPALLESFLSKANL
jgi:hypothetical protein